jgi:hypothetical protein
MDAIVRWGLVVVVAAHGLIHLLGAAKGLGWAEVAQISTPIGTGMGLAWLAAGLIVLAAAGLLAAQARWWWAVAAGAAVGSQAVIATAWADAAAGSAANVLLLGAAAYGYAAYGPSWFPMLSTAQHRRPGARQCSQNAHGFLGAGGYW